MSRNEGHLSWEGYRSLLPGRLGSNVLGSTAPILHTGTQIARRLIQWGSLANIKATAGSRVTFSPAFSGTPHMFLKMRGPAGPGTFAEMKNINSGGGTVESAAGGTYTVDYLAIDPTR